MKTVLKITVTVLCCAVLFFGVSYIVLSGELTESKSAKGKAESIPYYSHPENCGILLTLPEGDSALLYLDFENLSASLRFLEDYSSGSLRYDLIPADYNMGIDYNLLAGIIDRTGGAELDINGERLRYTGAMVTEYLSEMPSDIGRKKEVAEKIFEGISKNGFSKSDFVYIIENSGTDLLVPDCFYWPDYMKEMFSSAEVIA